MIDHFMWGYAGGKMAAASTPTPRNSGASKEDLHQVMERLDKLAIINMAMWSLIQEETSLTDEDLMERVKQIDLMDGKADGKVSKQIAKCSSCDRVMNQRHTRCLYCGHERVVVSPFDSVT